MISSILDQNIHKTLYTAEQTRELDHLAITELGIPGFTLMKRAGKALWRFIVKEYSFDGLVIFCGNGNNGGDGYVLAKHAYESGKAVTVVQVAKDIATLSTTLRGEALDAYNQIKDIKNLCVNFAAFEEKASETNYQNWLIVDSMLGTGLSGDVRGEFAAAIKLINDLPLKTIAVDIPSGLCANTGNSLGHTVEADSTLTFIGINRGLVTSKGADFTGELFYSDLDLPEALFKDIAPKHFISRQACFSYNDLNTRALKRMPSSHKGSSGRVLVIAGSEGFSGAAILCSGATLRAGAGLVTTLTSADAITPILTKYPEIMVRDLQKINSFDLQSFIDDSDSIVIGPGLSKSSHAKKILSAVLSAKKNTIIDADALNIIAQEDPEYWSKYGHSDCILTPHPKEAARLLDTDVEFINKDRFRSIDKLVKKYCCVVLLKGSGTVISNFDNNVFVCLNGNSEMAVGGMGDVLSGILGTVAIHEQTLIEATKLGVSLHAFTADRWVKSHRQRLLPSDLIEAIERP